MESCSFEIKHPSQEYFIHIKTLPPNFFCGGFNMTRDEWWTSVSSPICPKYWQKQIWTNMRAQIRQHRMWCQDQHCFQSSCRSCFFNTSTSSKMDIQILSQVWKKVKKVCQYLTLTMLLTNSADETRIYFSTKTQMSPPFWVSYCIVHSANIFILTNVIPREITKKV